MNSSRRRRIKLGFFTLMWCRKVMTTAKIKKLIELSQKILCGESGMAAILLVTGSLAAS